MGLGVVIALGYGAHLSESHDKTIPTDFPQAEAYCRNQYQSEFQLVVEDSNNPATMPAADSEMKIYTKDMDKCTDQYEAENH